MIAYKEVIEILYDYGYRTDNLNEEIINNYLDEIIKNNQESILSMQNELLDKQGY